MPPPPHHQYRNDKKMLRSLLSLLHLCISAQPFTRALGSLFEIYYGFRLILSATLTFYFHLQKTEATSRSQSFVSHTVIPEKRPSTEVFDVFQGLDLSSGNHTPNNDNNSRKAFQSSKSKLDDLFSATEETAGPTFVRKIQEPVKDSVTDLFDPLCNDSESSLGPRVTQPSVTSITGAVKETTTNSDTGPQLIGYENSLIFPQGNVVPPVNSSNVNTVNPRLVNIAAGSHPFDDLDGLSQNRTAQSHVTLPSSGPPMGNQYSLNFPNNSHPVVQPSVLSGASTIPLRLPKQPSQKTDFSFVGKSGKRDAFSFVQDEMKGRK